MDSSARSVLAQVTGGDASRTRPVLIARRVVVSVALIALITVAPARATSASIAAPSISLGASHGAAGETLSVSGTWWGLGENEGGGGCGSGGAVFYRSIDIVVSLSFSGLPVGASPVRLISFSLDRSAKGSWTRAVTLPLDTTSGPAVIHVAGTAANRVPAFERAIDFRVD